MQEMYMSGYNGLRYMSLHTRYTTPEYRFRNVLGNHKTIDIILIKIVQERNLSDNKSVPVWKVWLKRLTSKQYKKEALSATYTYFENETFRLHQSECNDKIYLASDDLLHSIFR